MDETYQMIGCIDFQTDSYAISVPVLRKQNSNYVYIPKTDHHFIVTDFYEVKELGYKVHYLLQERPVSISSKTPIPIIEAGNVYVVDADWTDAEIRTNHPRLGHEAIKAFVSLRTRMATKSVGVAHGEIEADIQDLLSNPARSRYWVSKFAALVRSAFESGDPPESLIRMMEDARLKWIEKYSTKTPVKLVTQLMQVPSLALQADPAKKVLLRRFERILGAKGIFVPRVELMAYEQLFPEGILPAIRADSDGQYDYWRRGGEIGKRINAQVYNFLHPADVTKSRIANPALWSLGELDRILRLFKVLGGDDHLLEQASGYFYPLYELLLADVRDFASDRYVWTSALSGRVNQRFINDASKLANLPLLNRLPKTEEWMKIIGAVLDSFRKLIVLAKIVRPHLRLSEDGEVAFEGVDYALVEALKKVYATKHPAAISSLLQAGNVK
ncbi:hypothetical protein CO653_13025 [Rhizobium anhuiense]|uniref:hypothetical protein n=1 Tax=Rhizobium anhuiense TaxID=1184720 RepID=UPI000BE9AFC2|nr:hypothetical protein [Rhizobium anhuiense]PDS65114.1 hypothetical protein CO653_13025 [Rhizobium anhuiense]